MPATQDVQNVQLVFGHSSDCREFSWLSRLQLRHASISNRGFPLAPELLWQHGSRGRYSVQPSGCVFEASLLSCWMLRWVAMVAFSVGNHYDVSNICAIYVNEQRYTI